MDESVGRPESTWRNRLLTFSASAGSGASARGVSSSAVRCAVCSTGQASCKGGAASPDEGGVAFASPGSVEAARCAASLPIWVETSGVGEDGRSAVEGAPVSETVSSGARLTCSGGVGAGRGRVGGGVGGGGAPGSAGRRAAFCRGGEGGGDCLSGFRCAGAAPGGDGLVLARCRTSDQLNCCVSLSVSFSRCSWLMARNTCSCRLWEAGAGFGEGDAAG